MTTNTYAADRTALLIVGPYNDFIGRRRQAVRGYPVGIGGAVANI